MSLGGWRAAVLIALLSLPSVALQARTLSACGHPFYPPVSWIERDRLEGLAAVVAERLFAELGYEVRLRADSNWKRCLREVEEGNADIVVAAYRIDTREHYLEYTKEPIVADRITLFVNRHRPLSVTKLSDLEGKTAGLLLGDTFGEEFDQFVQRHSKVEYVSTGRQNFGKLALGRIDYMPIGRLSGELQSQKLGVADRVKPLDWVIATEYYFLAIGRYSGLSRHLPYINRRLKEMRLDGTLDELTETSSQRYLKSPEAP